MKLEVLKHTPAATAEKPALLFVHGGSHGAWCWEEHFMPFFAERGYPACALSLRGHGNSEGLPGLHSYTLENYADDVQQVMLEGGVPVVLIGHSLGGAVVQKLLLRSLKHTKGAVLIASPPPAGMLRDKLALLGRSFNDARQIPLFNEGKSLRFPDRLFFSDQLDPGSRSRYISMMQPESKRASRELNRRFAGTGASSAVPMLILGSESDRIFPPPSTRRTGKAYGVTPVILKNVSHDMMLDPNWIQAAERIHDFLCESVL